jgi:hypothetical protein
MNTKELARRLAVLSKMLVAASIFFVLIWWRISAYVFVAGWLVFGVAWLIDGGVGPSPSIVPE